MIQPNQIYRDLDRGHVVRVLFVATPEAHQVRKAKAFCYYKGGVTTIGVERLTNPVRYQLVPEAEV